MGFFERLKQNRKRQLQNIKAFEMEAKKQEKKKKWNPIEVSNKKRRARKDALTELRENGLTKELFSNLNTYYKNDLSDFGSFSIDYYNISIMDWTKDREQMQNKFKEYLSKKAANSSFGRALNKAFNKHEKQMRLWKEELTKNLKDFYARIVDPKNKNIPVNMLAKLSSPDFKNLVAYIVETPTTRENIQNTAKITLGIIRDWFIKCNNFGLQNWKNAQITTENLYMWWTDFPPETWKSYYEWFFNPDATNKWNYLLRSLCTHLQEMKQK